MNPSHSERPYDADIAQAEAARVATVRSSIQHDRIETLEREVRLMRAVVAQMRRATADARAAGRAEAVEILHRLDPMRLVASHAQEFEGPGGVEHKWSKEGLATLLGVGTDNPITRVLESLESGYWDSAARLLDANLRIRDLQRQLELAHAPSQSLGNQAAQPTTQRVPSDGVRRNMQPR